MSPRTTLRTLKEMIAEICEIDASKIRDHGKLLGYGLDSVRVIDLLMAIEEHYDIEISESDPALSKVHTVADLCVLVESRRNADGRAG